MRTQKTYEQNGKSAVVKSIFMIMAMFLLLLNSAIADQPQVSIEEVTLSDADFKKLDTFEGHSLSKADQIFAKKEYRAAAKEYEAFELQNPKSAALAYALVRKGRSIQLDNKRNEAIRVYREVLDYFPNAVQYAGAALYFTGQCKYENGDKDAAVKDWAEMVTDEDYRKHPLAACALFGLAEYYTKMGKPEDANKYYMQAAIDFRGQGQSKNAVNAAIDKVVYYYIRQKPDQPKLWDFYTKVKSFYDNPRNTDENDYWGRVREFIRRYGEFKMPEQKKERGDFYGYWAKAMDGKRLDDDEYQIDVADYFLASDDDGKKWAERLDKQFASKFKDGDYGRIVRWIRAFRYNKDKVNEYYNKLNFAKMNNGQIESLMRSLYEDVNNPAMGKSTFDKLRQNELKDHDRNRLVDFFHHRDESIVVRLCMSMQDADAGKMRLLRYYTDKHNLEKGVPVADQLVSSPTYAKDAYWHKGLLLQHHNKFAEARAAYQMADKPPESLYRIADCFLGEGKKEQAIAQLKEVESFFEKEAPEAALRIAYVYKNSGDRKLAVANLRGVLKKYPKSGQSSKAHQELEAMGEKIGGGADAD